MPAVAALAEIGLASIGIDAVRQTAKELLECGRRVLAEWDAGLTGAEPNRAYDRLLGGRRRASRCTMLASGLPDYYRA